MVLFISIVLNNLETIRRLRRRLDKIVINIYISYAVFEEMIIKQLNISRFINIYNYYINGVDNAD